MHVSRALLFGTVFVNLRLRATPGKNSKFEVGIGFLTPFCKRVYPFALGLLLTGKHHFFLLSKQFVKFIGPGVPYPKISGGYSCTLYA